MPLWDTETTPKYISDHIKPLIHFDESGYWLIQLINTDRGTLKIKQELIVAIGDIDTVQMGVLGIPLRMELTDEWIDGYGLLVDAEGTYYFSTLDGYPIAVEV